LILDLSIPEQSSELDETGDYSIFPEDLQYRRSSRMAEKIATKTGSGKSATNSTGSRDKCVKKKPADKPRPKFKKKL